MNKLDKLLYGGFAIVIIGGIAAMLVSVFSPQNPIVEEIAEQPPEEVELPPEEPTQPENDYVAYYLDDEGNKVFLTAEDIAESEAYDEEFKRQEAERIAKEQAEKEWWESRQDWIDRFPFEPTHHPEIAYDPEAYDPSNLPPREERDEAYRQHRDLVHNHGFLRKFYESRLPYTEEFEQMYDIITEEVGEKAENTVMMGWAFDVLKDYHQARANDPDAIYRKNAQVYQPQPSPQPPPSILDGLTPQQLAAYKALPGAVRREMTAELRASRSKEMRKRIKDFHASQRYQTVDITWGEQAEHKKDAIIGSLMRHVQPDQPWLSREQATKIQERLLNEIPGEGFLEMGKENLCYVHRYKRELKPGDPLLIK